GCAAGAGWAAPASIRPITAPMATVCPSAAPIASVPLVGAMTSVVALSVSNSHTGSLAFTAAPLALSQRAIVPSVIDSPTAGTLISADMQTSLRNGSQTTSPERQRRGEEARRWRSGLVGRRDDTTIGHRTIRLGRVHTLGTDGTNQMGSVAGDGRLDQFFLLAPMNLHRAGRRAGAGIAADVLHVVAHTPQTRLHERPAAHVLRFFLCPHPFLGLAITHQGALQQFLREGIELLDADDRDVVGLRLRAALQQIVIYLAAAQDDSANASRIHLNIIEDFPEAPRDEFIQGRTGRLQTQQTLGRHDDQRLAEIAFHLPAQQMEILCRRRRIANLHVVFG